jgi:hypothetical protein
VAVADLAGFRDAQRRLRNEFAEEVTFLLPEQFEYPAGTPIDPETGEPYDPTVVPTVASAASAVVRCNVAFNTRNRSDEQQIQSGALGVFEQTHVMLIADIAAASAIAPAVEFDVRDARYKIEAQKPDGIGELQRYLVWGRQK